MIYLHGNMVNVDYIPIGSDNAAVAVKNLCAALQRTICDSERCTSGKVHFVWKCGARRLINIHQ